MADIELNTRGAGQAALPMSSKGLWVYVTRLLIGGNGIWSSFEPFQIAVVRKFVSELKGEGRGWFREKERESNGYIFYKNIIQKFPAPRYQVSTLLECV